jgi:AraC-like DNA-binding protein
MPGTGGPYRREPHAVLRPFVLEYWGLARDLGAMGGFTVTPDRHGELICCAGQMFAVRDGVREELPACFLIGLLDAPLRLESAGEVCVLSARLRAWAVGRVKTAAAGALGNWSDARHVLGTRLPLTQAAVLAREWRDAAEIMEQSLLDEVRRWNLGDAGTDLVTPFLAESPSATDEVAEEMATSGRQVERRVRALTGTSPKQLASLARFQRARDAIWADPLADLSRLAFDAGYSDQAHMTREFRRYAGETPARFARESAARKAWPSAQDVAFVQDPGTEEA